MRIRPAVPGDAGMLLHIYEQYIDTPATFEYALPAEQEFALRIAEIEQTYPYLVCEEGGRAVGYAYAHRHMLRAAYQWDAALSVYVARGSVSKGIGSRLYGALLELLKMQGVQVVFGCVTVPNDRSFALHYKMGFSRAGVWHRAGFKCGAWHDVAWFEKTLAAAAAEPRPVVPAAMLPAQAVEEVFQHFSTPQSGFTKDRDLL